MLFIGEFVKTKFTSWNFIESSYFWSIAYDNGSNVDQPHYVNLPKAYLFAKGFDMNEFPLIPKFADYCEQLFVSLWQTKYKSYSGQCELADSKILIPSQFDSFIHQGLEDTDLCFFTKKKEICRNETTFQYVFTISLGSSAPCLIRTVIRENGAKGTKGEEESSCVVNLNVVASSYELADEVANKIMDLLPPVPKNEDDTKVDIDFWMLAHNGPNSITRCLHVPTWEEIKDNYASNVQTKLEDLLSVDLDKFIDNGKLVLFHGPPGTGKTYMIRALAREWKKRCDFQYIMDTERFFNDPEYMLKVFLDSSGSPKKVKAGRELDAEPWRIIVIEDASELITEDASLRTGQGFSRLLNVTSGLLGQGMKILILITTNESIDNINSAVSREGRCVADLPFPHLSIDEAKDWCKQHDLDHDFPQDKKDVRLSELFSILNSSKTIKIETDEFPTKKEIGFGS